MPKGPRGERRPGDVIGAAIKVAKIATGEIEEDGYRMPGRKRSGQSGGNARATALSKEKRSAIAKRAAAMRWQKVGEVQ